MKIFVLLLLSSPAFALGPPSVTANQNGIEHFKKEDYSQAFKDFAKALSSDSKNPTFHFNLGDSFLKNGETDKAITEFENVEKNPKASNDLKFDSMFNAGNAALQNKDIPKALGYYQKALEYKPDSQEVKTNIELALKDPQGGGGGDNKDKNQNQNQNQDQKQNQSKGDQNKDQGNDKKDDKQQQGNQDQNKKEQPKPFQSQALNENDVRRILEELKRQEEQIRARQNADNKKAPEKNIEKDW